MACLQLLPPAQVHSYEWGLPLCRLSVVTTHEVARYSVKIQGEDNLKHVHDGCNHEMHRFQITLHTTAIGREDGDLLRVVVHVFIKDSVAPEFSCVQGRLESSKLQV